MDWDHEQAAAEECRANDTGWVGGHEIKRCRRCVGSGGDERRRCQFIAVIARR